MKPATEELFFRGYIVQGASTIWTNRVFLAIASAVIFTLPHLLNPEAIAGGWLTVILNYFVGTGLVWVVVSLVDGTTELAIGAHFANNIVAILAIDAPGTVVTAPALFTLSEYHATYVALAVLVIVPIFLTIAYKVFRRDEASELVSQSHRKGRWSPAPSEVIAGRGTVLKGVHHHVSSFFNPQNRDLLTHDSIPTAFTRRRMMRVCKTYVRRLLTVAAVMLLLLAGAPAASAQTAQEPAAELERFYNQELTFGSCEGYATTDADAETFANDTFECARLEVPLDYENPDGRTAQIALLRVPAKGEPIGSLLLNPGGPGFSGMSHAPLVATTLGEHPITERFDLIGFDPRGVGASTPTLDCFTDAERESDVKFSTLNSGVEDYTEAETRQLYERCAERSGGEDVLAHVGTRDVVRDMDVLRAVLGDKKLTFAGQSYGTRLGAVYAETFPQNVRAMVLDAAMDPTTGTTERRLVQFEGFQNAFDNMATFCTESPDCPLGTDPEQAAAVFQGMLQPLIDEPVITADGRELTYTATLDGLILSLYSETAWPAAIQGIAELKAGRGDTLMLLRDLYHQRAADGSYGNDSEATLAINCLDEERHTPEQETAMKRGIFEVAPFMDTSRPVEARDICEHWPVQPTLGYPYAQDIEGLPETLIVSVTGDPATPHSGGISLAETLGGTLLTVEGEQHGAALIAGNACVDDIVADYLINLELPADGDRCVL
jgi:pimeloyl-ACP methyl ester carboxylesterase